MNFKGSENSLWFRNEYFEDYSCQFDLHNYPFDTQDCEMRFLVNGKTDSYVKLTVEPNGIEFMGKLSMHSIFPF